VLPAVLYLATYFVIRHYPLDRKMQAETVARLEARNLQQTADPLDVVKADA
jgi:Na+/melibiose symporter-like transporter